MEHDLSKKDELLRMVASASEESETDSSVSTPLRQTRPPGGTTAAAALSQLESLQGKLQDLEEENLSLRSEVREVKGEALNHRPHFEKLVDSRINK